jgi:FtsH-binding integral membrane protein
LIAFDTQKIKNIDLNIVKTDNQVARSAILLCALTFFLDFSLSIFRVLLPWGEKK